MSVGREVRARAEREQRARDQVLVRLRQWSDRGGRTEEQLAHSLQWPGGAIGVGAVLRDLAERGEAHERAGGWLPDRPGEDDMGYAQRVKAERIQAGLSQRQVGERCGWSQVTQCRIEDGRKVPSDDEKALLERVLGIGAQPATPPPAAAPPASAPAPTGVPVPGDQPTAGDAVAVVEEIMALEPSGPRSGVAEVAALQARCAELDREAGQLAQALDAAKAKCDELEDTRGALVRAMDEHRDERDRALEGQEQLRGQLDASRSKVEQLERELAASRRAFGDLDADRIVAITVLRQFVLAHADTSAVSAWARSASTVTAQALDQIDLLRRELADARAPSALDEAANEIARLCGCPTWDYPGQLVRDVRALVDERDALRLERDQGREAIGSQAARISDTLSELADALNERDRARRGLLELVHREQRPAGVASLDDLVELVTRRVLHLLERLGEAVDGRHEAHLVGQLAERVVASVPDTLGPEFPLTVRLAHLLGVQDVWRKRAAAPVIVLNGGASGGGTDA